MNFCDTNLIVNADATTFAVYGNSLITILVVMKQDEISPPAVSNNENFLEIYIKAINQISLGCFSAPSVFLVAEGSLGEEGFIEFPVHRLSHECHARAFGWVCICKTRYANEAFYVWVYEFSAVLTELLIIITIIVTCKCVEAKRVNAAGKIARMKTKNKSSKMKGRGYISSDSG